MDIDVIDEGTSLPVAVENVSEENRMILALSQADKMDALEKYLELKEQERARASRLEFEKNFALMQSKFEPIARSKKTDKSKYAPLESFQRKYGPIISEHGFSYRWDEQPLDGGAMRITMTISGFGHSVTCSKDLPHYEPDRGSQSGKAIMNSLQAEGVRSTYGRRYTFKSGFGIAEEDEDTDGAFDSNRFIDYENALYSATDMAELARVWKEMVYPDVKTNPQAIRHLTGVKDVRKRELNGR